MLPYHAMTVSRPKLFQFGRRPQRPSFRPPSAYAMDTRLWGVRLFQLGMLMHDRVDQGHTVWERGRRRLRLPRACLTHRYPRPATPDNCL